MPYARRIPVMVVDSRQVATTLSVQELLELIVPARAFMPNAKNDPVTARLVRDLGEYHGSIQRDLSGQKLKNAKSDLRRYIENEWLPEDGSGILPPVLVWFPDTLKIDQPEGSPVQEASIPAGERGLLLDAESRIEAILYSIESDDMTQEDVHELLAKRLPVVIFHGVQAALASKWFSDVNGRGVQVNRNLLSAREIGDPWHDVVDAVFTGLDVPLERERRQVSDRTEAVFTVLAARNMVAAMVYGVGAIAHGTSRIPSDDTDFDRLRAGAQEWISRVLERFGTQAFKDPNLVLKGVPVIVSLGALGKPYYLGDEAGRRAADHILNDPGIDWSKGPNWSGVCGKVNAQGSFSFGSGKENAYSTYRALTDHSDPGYKQVRALTPALP